MNTSLKYMEYMEQQFFLRIRVGSMVGKNVLNYDSIYTCFRLSTPQAYNHVHLEHQRHLYT